MNIILMKKNPLLQLTIIATILLLLLSTDMKAADTTSVKSPKEPVELNSYASEADRIFLPGRPIHNDNYHGIITRTNPFGTTTREDFNSPTYFTFNLEKKLKFGERKPLSIGLGIGVLTVISSLSYDTYFASYQMKIRRSYIAIPLYVKYDFLVDKRIKFYTSVGITSEIGLSGKSTTKEFENEERIRTTTENFKLGIGQFNVNAGIGVNVKLSKHFNLFTEASLAHYFHESRYTIWSDKNFWFNIKSGIGILF